MSHVVTTKVKYKSLTALKKAFARLGGTWQENKKTFKWYNKWVNDYHEEDAAYKTMNTKDFGKCDHAVSFPNCNYEVGVIKQGEEYAVVWDFYDSKLEKIMGTGSSSLLPQLYSCELAKEVLSRDGYEYVEMNDKEGNLILNFYKETW